MTQATAELSDTYETMIQVAQPLFRNYGGACEFSGPIATVQVIEDNTSVRTMLAQEGHGRVLVIDGGGSLRSALVGDQMAQLALDNGWAGFVVNGCVRDTSSLEEMRLGVRALAAMPRRCQKQTAGREEVMVIFAGVQFQPGHYLYADSDGIVVSPVALE